MNADRRCPHCGKSGSVRAEHVIKGQNGTTELRCGACGSSWSEVEERPAVDEKKRSPFDDRSGGA